MDDIFRTYDVRGLYPSEVNEEFAYNLGLAFANYIKGEILVCRDGRLSSESLKESFVKGVLDAGFDVLDIGLASTPYAYYALLQRGKGGVVVTASHNPKDYNGFKLLKEKAYPISKGKGLEEIKELMNKTKNKSVKGTLKEKNYFKEYKDFLKKFLVKSDLKIIIDQSHGSGWIESSVLKEFYDAVLINNDIDGNFPSHGPDPKQETNQEQIKKLVLEKKADLGVILDGDADRVMFIDEKGSWIKPDLASLLLLEDFRDGVIVCDVACTKQLAETAKEYGIKTIISKIGRTNISEKVHEINADYGVEVSGHAFFKEFNGFDNPFIKIAKLIKNMTLQKERLSSVLKKMSYYQSGEYNYKTNNKDDIIKKVKELYKDYEQDELDGLSIHAKDYWFNIRKSNTESLLRLNVESKDKNTMKQILKELKKIING